MSRTATRSQPAPGHGSRQAASRAGLPGGAAFGLEAPALALQRGAGNQAVAGLLRTSIRVPTLQRCACDKGGTKCAKCQQEDQEVLRRSAAPGAAPPAPSAGAMVQSVSSSPGSRLASGVRQQMESHFNVSFDGVRVHTDKAAAASADAVSAQAYAVGQHIVFSRSSYSPGTPAGRHLLAHELAHTIQQRGASRSLQPKLTSDAGSEGVAEREADSAAAAVMRGRLSPPVMAHRSVPTLRLKKKRSAWGRAAKGKLINDAAGGCGVCYGPAGLAAAGSAVHAQVALKVRAQLAWLLDNEVLKKAGAATSDIPDLFDYVAEAPGARRKAVRIGELKPNSKHGRDQGKKQMARYRRNIRMLPTFKNTTILPLTMKLPDGFDFDDPTRPAGCAKQTIRIQYWKDGIYLYNCKPPWKDLVGRPGCECPDDKKKKKKKKKDNKKQDKKKAGKKATKKPATKPKPKPKPKPKVKATKPKVPGAKGPSLSLGIGINSSGAGAFNVGVGISVNSSGASVGTVGACAMFDSVGNAIAAVGATAAKGSSANVAGGAALTAADDSSATGAGVIAKGTAKGSDVMGAGIAAEGTAKGVTGTAFGKAGSGDHEDVDLDKAGSGKDEEGGEPSDSKAPPGAKGQKPGGEGGEAGEEGDIKDTEEFKQAQAEAKRIEAMFKAASPAQKKLIAELVKRHPEHLLPVPNEAFTKAWLGATADIKDEDIAKLAAAGWQAGTDIDEAEFKRRVQLVVSGKMPTGALWTSPKPPPPPAAKPDKEPDKKGDKPELAGDRKSEVVEKPRPKKAKDAKDPDDQYRGTLAKQAEAEGMKPAELRAKLKEIAKTATWPKQGYIIVFEDGDLKNEESVLTRVVYHTSKRANVVSLSTFRLTKKGNKYYAKFLDHTEGVAADGRAFEIVSSGKEERLTFPK